MALKVATGSFVGDGADDRDITGVGFQPDLVIVSGYAGSRATVFRCASHTGDDTSHFDNIANEANNIQALLSDGFQVGTDAYVNASGVTYRWIAFKFNAAIAACGKYTGDGADDRGITGVGFQPDLVWVKAATSRSPAAKTSDMAGEKCVHLDGTTASASDEIQSLDADGFTVGTDLDVNTNGVEYFWVAFKKRASVVDVGTYTGDGLDDRAIAVGFQPDWCFTKVDGSTVGVHRDASVAGDISKGFDVTGAAVNKIQEMLATGFQVGTHSSVNANGLTYFWAAFQDEEVLVPLDKPVFAAHSRLPLDTLTSTPAEDVDFPKTNLYDGRVFTTFKPGSGATEVLVKTDAGVGQTAAVDYFGLVGHDLGTLVAQLAFEWSDDDAAWNSVFAVCPTDDAIIFRVFTSVSHRFFRVRLNRGTSFVPTLGEMQWGVRVTAPYGIGVRFDPQEERLMSRFARAQTGNLLGAVSLYSERRARISLPLSPNSWVRGTTLGTFGYFWDGHAALLRPFFFSWNPGNPGAFEKDTFFCVVDPEAGIRRPLATQLAVGAQDLDIAVVGVKE